MGRSDVTRTEVRRARTSVSCRLDSQREQVGVGVSIPPLRPGYGAPVIPQASFSHTRGVSDGQDVIRRPRPPFASMSVLGQIVYRERPPSERLRLIGDTDITDRGSILWSIREEQGWQSWVASTATPCDALRRPTPERPCSWPNAWRTWWATNSTSACRPSRRPVRRTGPSGEQPKLLSSREAHRVGAARRMVAEDTGSVAVRSKSRVAVRSKARVAVRSRAPPERNRPPSLPARPTATSPRPHYSSSSGSLGDNPSCDHATPGRRDRATRYHRDRATVRRYRARHHRRDRAPVPELRPPERLAKRPGRPKSGFSSDAVPCVFGLAFW
jgi:hypothetical protein